MITVLQGENQVNRAVNRCHLRVGPGTAGPRGTGDQEGTAGPRGTGTGRGLVCPLIRCKIQISLPVKDRQLTMVILQDFLRERYGIY